MAATDYIETLYNTSIRGFNILDDYFSSVIKPYTEPAKTPEVPQAKIAQSVIEPPKASEKSETGPEPANVENKTDAPDIKTLHAEIDQLIQSTLEIIRNIKDSDINFVQQDKKENIPSIKMESENVVDSKSESPLESDVKGISENNGIERVPDVVDKKIDVNVTMEDVLDEKIDEIIAYIQSFQLFLLADNQICTIRDFLSKILESRGNIEETIQGYLERTFNILSYKEIERLKQSDVLALQEELEHSFSK